MPWVQPSGFATTQVVQIPGPGFATASSYVLMVISVQQGSSKRNRRTRSPANPHASRACGPSRLPDATVPGRRESCSTSWMTSSANLRHRTRAAPRHLPRVDGIGRAAPIAFHLASTEPNQAHFGKGSAIRGGGDDQRLSSGQDVPSFGSTVRRSKRRLLCCAEVGHAVVVRSRGRVGQTARRARQRGGPPGGRRPRAVVDRSVAVGAGQRPGCMRSGAEGAVAGACAARHLMSV
jgi:hypothetical protein